MTFVTETDLKANKIYYKLTEKERSYVYTINLVYFRHTLDLLDIFRIDIVLWIRFIYLSRRIPDSVKEWLFTDINTDNYNSWFREALRRIYIWRSVQIFQILRPHLVWLYSVPTRSLKYVIYAISRDQLGDFSYSDLLEYLLESTKR